MQLAERKIPIQYTSSTVQTRKKDMTYLPLKINSASVIPVIFASAIMVAPLQIARMFASADTVSTMTKYLGLQTPISLTIYVILRPAHNQDIHFYHLLASNKSSIRLL